MARQLAVRRYVSEEEFETACETWKPKIVKFATNRIPFLDWDDKIQEGRLVLLNCLELFEDGFISKKDGAGKGLKTIFHTYLHRALHNRAGILTYRPLMHNAETAKLVPALNAHGEPLLKGNGDPKEKCVEDPSLITYIGEIDAVGDEGYSYASEKRGLSVGFETSLEFEVKSWGFVGMEVTYMIGKVVHDITIEETARMFGVSPIKLERAQKRAERKIRALSRGYAL